MRQWLLFGCALVALQPAPAAALTEPEQMRPDSARGDDRIRQVYWRPGMVIKLAGAQGQTLMVEMPKEYSVDIAMPSEQSVIKPDDYTEVDPATGKEVTRAIQIKPEDDCVKTIDLKVCKRRERFLFFVPYVELDAQSFPLLMLEKKKRKGKPDEELEHSIIFELSTVEKNARPYYGVKVLVGDPPAPAVLAPPSVSHETPQEASPAVPYVHVAPSYKPTVVIPAKPGMTRQDRERLKELDRAKAPPPEINSKYVIQGDQNLIGR